MPRTPSSQAWIADRYSRLLGSIARHEGQIIQANQRLEFHRAHAQQYEARLVRLRMALALARQKLPAIERTLRIHDDAADVRALEPVKPHEQPRVARYGEMTRWLYRTLRAAPDQTLSTEQLHSGWVAHVGAPPELASRLLWRLQTRLNVLVATGKLASPDPPRTRGRRWRLGTVTINSRLKAPAARPKRKRPHRGSTVPALWLIRTQQQLRAALRQPTDAKGRRQLMRNLRAVEKAWTAHPMWFSIDPERVPADTPYRRAVRAQVTDRLATTQWATLDELYTRSPQLTARGRRVAIDAVKKALQYLVLEGRVIHRRPGAHLQVEWCLVDQTPAVEPAQLSREAAP